MGPLRFLARNLEEILSSIFLVLMFLSTFTNVVARYVFNHPFPWAEEFSRYAFIWLVFMGAALTTKQKKHIVIDTVLVILPTRVRPAVNLLADLASMSLMLILVYFGFVLMTYATQPTATMKIPQYLVYLCVPLSAALIILHSLADIRDNFRMLLNGGERL